ncbi:DUF3168 domain-containing protein [uncultured Paracoccus sp.]|uniref:tail completion protein gp17 n=1 Tax=uncultured Paracoccus sp. TaxID=189685 RepID=UPI0025FD7B1A|nr:DUF3168 domain-containing protein [uncultured Paracoccus sp.]
MRAGAALRRAVAGRLVAEVPDLGGRVWDRSSKGDILPYVTLGPSYWSDASVQCVAVRAITLQVDVWCSGAAGAGKGDAEDVIDDVATALNDWMDQDALTAHPLRVIMVRVMDDPSGVVHGVVQVEALVEG